MKLFKFVLLLDLIFIGMTHNVNAMDGSSEESQEKNFRNKVLVNFFENELSNFSKLAYHNIPHKDPQEPLPPKAYSSLENPSFEVIYNQDFYAYGGDSKEGSSFRISDMPVGYTFYIPQMPQGILVEVYGGGGDLFLPHEADLKPFHKSLLRSRMAIVRLNLIDRHEKHPLRLEGGIAKQQRMYQETFDAVLESINAFCSTLKHHPENLHNDLKPLKEIPLLLFGHSFGGLVSISYAERYSHQGNVDGCISFNGGLKGDMPGWAEQRIRARYLNKVNDCEEINKITKPILLLHTPTDSNVILDATNDWAKKARKILFKNKVPLDVFYDRHINPGEVKGEGHYIPEDGIALEEY